MTQEEWKEVAGTYHRWATDSIVIHRKTRLSHDSANQVISSVQRLLKDRARPMGIPAGFLAPLCVAEDVDAVSAWVKGQSNTRAYLSKQVFIRGYALSLTLPHHSLEILVLYPYALCLPLHLSSPYLCLLISPSASLGCISPPHTPISLSTPLPLSQYPH